MEWVTSNLGRGILQYLRFSTLCFLESALLALILFLVAFLPLETKAAQEDPLLQTYLYDVPNLLSNSVKTDFSSAFTYSVPIVIPPGRNAVQPNLTFSYSNQDTRDLNVVGYGWDVPIPYIERINKSGVDDLYTEPVFYSTLSGELATTTDSSLFYPRSDDGSYLQYSFASSTNKWTVTDKNGTIYKFGHASTTQIASSTDSTKVFRWMLEETRDTNGNYVSYEYYKDSGYIYPSQITYTGNGTTDGIFTVDFSRELRPDTATSTAPGFEIEARYRINQVVISVDGTWVRKYDLTYTTGDNDKRTLLDTITETGQSFDTGSAVTASLPAINFQYQAVNAGWATTTTNFSIPKPFREAYVDTGTRLFDYNSDSLPDIVRSKSGTSTLMYANDGDEWNLDTGWSFPEFFVDSDGVDQGVRLVDLNGDGRTDVMKSNPVSTVSYLNTGSGFATSSTWASPLVLADSYGADTGVRTADVNGDGLIDILYSEYLPQYGTSNQSVYLNTGAGWEAANWEIPVGFISLFGTKETLGVAVEDVNNDGLADLITADDEQMGNVDEGVFINTGAGWALESSWNVPAALASDGIDFAQRFFDVNGDKLVDVLDGYGTHRDVYLNNGSNWVIDSSWHLPTELSSENGYATQFGDVDADGLIDIVQKNGIVHNRYINQSNMVDMLVHIDESIGGDIDVTYQPSASSTVNSDLPVSLQTVSAIGKTDGLGATATTTFQYENGLFYFNTPLDRTFSGFGAVISTDPLGNVTKSYLHQANATATSTGEYDDHRSKIGRIYRAETYDDSNNLFRLQITGWDHFNRGNNADFVFVATSTLFSYDGDSDHKDTADTFSYSTTTGSVLQKVAWGEVSGSTNGTFTDTGSDKRTTTFTYAASSTSPLLLPSQEIVTNQSGTKVRETKNYYDTLAHGSITKGNLTKQELWKSGSDYIDVEKTYNSYGLVTEEKDPRDKTTTFAYDTHNLYVATTTNALSQVVGRAYDYSSGKVNRLTDVNNRVYQTLFDPFDRPIEEKQPDLVAPTTLVMRTTYSYTDTGMPRRILKTDYLGSATSTVTYTYLDGNNKAVEERVEAEGNNTYTVRDFTYDLQGLLSVETLPFFASSTAYTATSSPAANALRIEYEYDPLQRVTSVTNVLGETTNTYDQWRTTTTDALSNAKEFLKDAYGNLTEVVEHNGASSYITTYEYDANNKLTKITDAESNVRNFTYDGLGRRLTAQDLHDAGDGTYGTWSYAYDASSNLTSQTDPKSQTVDFTYDDINRVLTENYTGAAGTEVSYGYDSCSDGVGRLCTATSTDAVSTFTYNPLGLVATESKTIDGTTYTTSYAYDRIGNNTLTTYPDSSQVSYAYNDAGQLESLAQKESGGSFASLVSDFDYAPTGKLTYKAFSNGVTSTYTYDATKLYRLINILTVAPEGGESLMGGGEGGGELSALYEPSNFALVGPRIPEAEQAYFAAVLFEEDLGASVSPLSKEETTLSESSTPEEIPITVEEQSVLETSVPESTATSTDPVPDIATTTDSVPEELIIDALAPFITDTATSTEIFATSTPVIVPESDKKFLLTAASGRAAPFGGNIKTEEIGKNEKGDSIYEAKIYPNDITYIDSVTSERKDINILLREQSESWEMTEAPYAARLSKEAGDKAVTYKTGNLELYFTVNSISKLQALGVMKEVDGRSFVRYVDALAPGVSLEVTVAPNALYKEAIIEDQKALESLIVSEGFVEVPFLLQSNENITLTATDGKTLSNDENLTTGNVVRVEGESGEFAYFKAPLAQDAEGNTIPIDIRYEKTAEGVMLTKLIPTKWLATAVYPLRTDTVVTYNPAENAGGQLKRELDNSWSGAHDATSGTANTGELARVQSSKSSSQYSIFRTALPFDTSGLPDNASISSAYMSVYVDSKSNSDNDGDDYIRVVQTTTASSTSITAEDYDQIGSVDNPTAGASDSDISDISTNGWKNFSLNATGIGWINLTGHTKLGLREGHDVVDTAPDGGTNVGNGIVINMPAYGSMYRAPELVVTYTTPVPPSAPTDLLTEELTNPTDITDYAPEFSAIFQDADDGDIATSYQLQVATSTSYWGAPIWDSGQTTVPGTLVEGSRSDPISYEGSSLSPTTTYYWRIKFWDQSSAGSWSTATSSFSIASSSASITPTYKGISNGTWAGASTINIAKPTGLEEGDLMLAIIATDSSIGTTPTGWTSINSAINTGNKVGLSVFGKIAQSDDVATSTYTFSGSGWAINGSILRVADADLPTATSTLVYKASSWGSNPSTFSPGITPIKPEQLMVMAFHASQEQESYNGYTIASSTPAWVERMDSSSSLDSEHMFAIATGNRATSTPTGAFSVNTSVSGTSEAGYGLLLALYGNSPPSAPISLQTEGQTNPPIVTDETPEFSAMYQDLDDSDIAAYYQIQVATSTSFTSPFWDSGKSVMTASTTEGSRSPEISYAGSDLTRETTYYWRIKFWDDNNVQGEWSSVGNFYYAISGESDVLQDITYTYDAVGNITKITDVSGTQAAKVVLFSYDDLYRLTTASTTAASTTPFSHAYSYSPIGNLSSSTPNGAYTYGETGYTNPHAPTNIGGTSLTYDTNGNLTAHGSTTYAFDYRNRLASTTGAVYGYDHTMQRVFKEVGATTTVYANKLYSFDGTTKTKHVFAGGELIATIETVGATSTPQYVHADHLGSTNVVSSADAEILEVLDYLPFGDQRMSVQNGSFSEDRKYVGIEHDSESDLEYANARYLRSTTGQFISQDPMFWSLPSSLLVDPQVQNSYSYAKNNPLTYRDNTGEVPNQLQSTTYTNITTIIQSIEFQNPDFTHNQIITAVAVTYQEAVDDASNPRYIYTSSRGWIDSKHFFAALDSSQKRGGLITRLLGYGVEVQQSIDRSPSAFSYEDLSSNALGIEFASYVKATLKKDKSVKLSQLYSDFMTQNEAKDPSESPNYDSLPKEPDDQKGKSNITSRNNINKPKGK